MKPSQMDNLGDLPHYYIEITNACYVCHVLQQILNTRELLMKALLEVYDYTNHPNNGLTQICNYHKDMLFRWENGKSTILDTEADRNILKPLIL